LEAGGVSVLGEDYCTLAVHEGGLLAEQRRVCEEVRAMLAVLQPRVTSGETTIGEVATPQESGRLEGLWCRSDEIAAALDAIDAAQGVNRETDRVGDRGRSGVAPRGAMQRLDGENESRSDH
jgi:hypothetical protein